MFNRRQFLGAGAAGAAFVSSTAWGQTSNMGLPEAAIMDSATTQTPVRPTSGPDYTPVVTLNGWTLPHRMNNGVKEFHLVAEPVEREMAEGMTAYLWGYNGQSPGPTIEAVEGDRVRIFVTNKLPAIAPVMKAPIGCMMLEPAHIATKPAKAPLCTKPGSFRPASSAARMPPHIAISELMATNPDSARRFCALMTLKPNQPMHRNHEPIASQGIEDGGGLIGRERSYRPMRGPS